MWPSGALDEFLLALGAIMRYALEVGLYMYNHDQRTGYSICMYVQVVYVCLHGGD